MIEKTGFCNTGSQVGRIGQRREFVTDIRAGDNHTGGDGRIHAQAFADGHERNTDGSGGGPRRTAGQTNDGDEDAAYRKEELGG